MAEIFDEAVAEKIRNGLIQHVSVGADYQVMDVVDAKVPRGLYNAELSLVAVPGMPETTIQVLEHLQPFGNGEEILEEKDLECLAEKLAAKLKVKEAVSLKCPKCCTEFDEAEWEANGWKCPNAECGVEVEPPAAPALTLKDEASVAAEKLAESERRLGVAEQTVTSQKTLLERYRAVAPGVELLAEAPVLMPVSECLERLGRLELPKMLERLSLGNQVQAQKVRKRNLSS